MSNLKIVLFLFLFNSTHLVANTKGNSISDVDTVATKYYFSMILANGQVAINTTGVGVKYCGAWQLKKSPRVGIGPSIFLERIQFQKSIKLPVNVTEASISLITPGLNIQYRFNKIISAQIGLSVLIGNEKTTTIYYVNTNPNFFGQPKLELRERKKEELIGGLQIEQNILYLPQQKTGMTFGIGLFERFISSSFYDTDLGGKIYLGFYF